MQIILLRKNVNNYLQVIFQNFNNYLEYNKLTFIYSIKVNQILSTV
jgi:hypothetical protein